MPARAGGCAGGRGSRARQTWLLVSGRAWRGSGEAVTTQSLGTPWEGQQAAWEGLVQVSRRRGSCAGGRGQGGTGSSGGGAGRGAVEGCSPSKALSVGGLEGPRE